MAYKRPSPGVARRQFATQQRRKKQAGAQSSYERGLAQAKNMRGLNPGMKNKLKTAPKSVKAAKSYFGATAGRVKTGGGVQKKASGGIGISKKRKDPRKK